LGAITELQALRHGPALLFDPLKSLPAGCRVMASLMNEPRRVALLMGLGRPHAGVDSVRAIRDRFNALQPVDPVEGSEAGFAEVCSRGAEWTYAACRRRCGASEMAVAIWAQAAWW
jgi:hypothetical protein